MFKLEFSTDNDAFAEFPTVEIARVLGRVINTLNLADLRANVSLHIACRDSNGNAIGEWEFKPQEP